MLNKRFKIAKCKTSLKLATSRIKLMRNKKGVQINVMKKELAQLLESGQDRTARIRVEHVIREEKMVAAYDLIEIYCELIVARLPIIESQKTCPIDLKEAVASVIFASPRCSDIPELVDAKKNFTAKYGKEFVSAAIELRPDCGVSRMLVEKLSAVAPDVQTKVKVLSDVAKEHNINWDPTSFEEKESKPPDDLLNGPTYFEKASTISVGSPKIQTSNVQNMHSEGNPNGHFDFAQQNRRFTVETQKSFASTTNHDMRPSGLGSGMLNTSQSFPSNNSNSPSGRENWNMEFKDATSAAQAAAESAERASFAARAAAQLSSQDRMTRQSSTESYSSEQRPQVSSEYTGQHNFKDSYNNTSFNDRNPKIPSQQMGPTGIDTSPKATKKSNSLRSRNDSIKEDSVNHFETHETSSKTRFTNRDNEGSSKSANVDYYGEGVIKKQPSITSTKENSVNHFETHETGSKKESRARFTNRDNEGSSKSANVDYYGEGVIKKQPSIASTKENSVNHFETHETSSKKESRARFANRNNEGSSNSAKVDYYGEEVIKKQPSITPSRTHSTTIGNERETTKYDGARTDDDSDSDDGPRFDIGFEYDEGKAKSFFPSPDRESFHAPEKMHISIPSPKKNTSYNVGQVDYAKPIDHSVKFDHSDGPDSETETETTKSSFSGTKKSTFRVDPAYVEPPPKVNPTKSRIELNDLVETGSTYHNEYDDFDTGKDLKFGPLMGGLRNKKTAVKESSVKSDPTSKQSSFNSRASRPDSKSKKPSVSMSSSDSDSDDYNEAFPVRKSFKTRSQFAPPDKFFKNYETDSDEEVVSSVSKQTSTGKVHLGPALSRRTKGQVEPAGKTVISNPDPKHEPLKTSSTSAEQKSNTRSNITKSPPESRPDPTRFKQEPPLTKPDPKIFEPPLNLRKKTEESGKTEAPETLKLSSRPDLRPDPTRFKQESPRTKPDRKVFEPPLNLRKKTEEPGKTESPETMKLSSRPEPRTDPTRLKQEPPRTKPDSKIFEPPLNLRKKIEEPGKTEAPETLNLSSETKLEANNAKKPSHVHPKLPDYDSLAARIQALSKMNHQ